MTCTIQIISYHPLVIKKFFKKGRHRKKHRKNKWAKELLWQLDMANSFDCFRAEQNYIEQHGETWLNSTYRCNCPRIENHKEVWR